MLGALRGKESCGVLTRLVSRAAHDFRVCKNCCNTSTISKTCVCHLHFFFLSVHQELPVNVKFVIEGMEETGSNGLDAMILAQRDTFFSDVDYIIISDCGWLSRRPALTYGTRGNCYFYAEV